MSMDVPRSATRPRRRRTIVLGALALAGVALTTVALGRLGAAAPTVDRASLFIDTVRRGPLVREINGQGQLVPEDVRFISAAAAARVEKIEVRPGSAVTASTVVMVLANPELVLTALEAERQLAAAAADLANLRASLEGASLAQRSQVASLQMELGDARRREKADDALAAKGFLSDLERGQSRDRVRALDGRLDFEEKRAAALDRGHLAQLAAAHAQVDRQRAIAETRRHEVDALAVRAGVAGVLEELPWQVGQSVPAGALLAKVARPDKLRAELRVPEVQAKDLALGLPAVIDTHSALIHGRVTRIDPAVQGSYVKVDVTLGDPLPPDARPALSVTGTIELERLESVLFVGRPAETSATATVNLLRLAADGGSAMRTPVRLGRGSIKVVEVVSGLAEGDRVILSDLSKWSAADRVRLR